MPCSSSFDKVLFFKLTCYSVVYFTWEHSNENEHEEKCCNGEDQHEYSLHETCHHMLALVIDLIYLRLCFLNIFLL